jgi:hypothetical protein
MRTAIPLRDGGRIWDAFREFGQLSEHEATRALTWGQDPIVRFVRLGAQKLGLFVPSAPNAVLVSYAVADAYERAPGLRTNQLCLEALVLHEMVHWGDWRHDRTSRPDRVQGSLRLDAGDQFEVAAYGFNVGQAGSFGMYLRVQQRARERIRDRQFDATFGSPTDI